MSPEINLDFFLRIIFLSILHPSLAVLFPIIFYIQGYGLFHPSVIWSGAYASVVCILYGIGHFSKKIRNGWKSTQTSWDDEVVVITGGSRGIGSLVAETLAIRNAIVVVLDIEPPEIEDGKVEYYQCDVSKLEEVEKVAKEIIDDVGHPTILINNAGVVKGKSILEESEEEIRDTFEANLLSSFWTTKVFLPEMVKNNHGHIVTVSSALGYVGVPQAADYCASKAGLIAFHESLRGELDTRYNAKQVRTTLVCPGHVQTGLFEGVSVSMPFITPTLPPLDVAKRIITALDKYESVDIFTPYYVNLVPLLRCLPGAFTDIVRQVSGANDGMRTWINTRGNTKKNQ